LNCITSNEIGTKGNAQARQLSALDLCQAADDSEDFKMTLTRERFEQGLTYEAYKAQMTRNRDRWEENERTVALLDEDVQFFSTLPQTLNVLVLTEDWCEAAISNLPVLVRLAVVSSQLNLRFFLRDQNLDLMDQFLKDDVHRAIPTIVFFDDAFCQLGIWVERPAIIAERQGQRLHELYAADPALIGMTPGTPIAQLPEAARMCLIQSFKAFRAETRELSDREMVREVRELIARSLIRAA
jgi:hypothetical protein